MEGFKKISTSNTTVWLLAGTRVTVRVFLMETPVLPARVGLSALTLNRLSRFPGARDWNFVG
jgi:hypothetical protein